MSCPRCGGLMVTERLLDLWDTNIETEARRCILCGEVLDAVIMRNRSGRAAASGRCVASLVSCFKRITVSRITAM